MEALPLDVSTSLLILAGVIAGATATAVWYLRSRRRTEVLENRQLLVGPRYRLGDELGRGMNAVTYRVQDEEESDVPLAAKLLLTSDDDPRITHESFGRHIARFEREMDNLERLKGSEYVVPVHAYHRNALRPFFVMHYCETSLSKRFQEHPMRMQDMLNVLVSVCRGLKDSHQRDIYHRDLKPSNILCCRGRWVLADFGMSLLGSDDSMVTVPESLAGTIPYTAPEVIYPGAGVVGPPTDIFSLGVTLMWMLTGSTSRAVPPSRRLGSYVDDQTRREVAQFDDLVMEMISWTQSERPQNVDDVCQRLRKAFEQINTVRAGSAPALGRIQGVDELTGRYTNAQSP